MSNDRLGLDVLASAEAASPVRSLDVVARNLRVRFGARSVSFLLPDVIGQKMVRVCQDAGPAAWSCPSCSVTPPPSTRVRWSR